MYPKPILTIIYPPYCLVASLLFVSLFFLFQPASYAENLPDDHYYYWVGFSDKINSPFSKKNPEDFLSTRAIERRNRQGITINESDLPVDPRYIHRVASEPAVFHLYSSRWLNGMVVKTKLTPGELQTTLSESFITTIDLIKPRVDTEIKRDASSVPPDAIHQLPGLMVECSERVSPSVEFAVNNSDSPRSFMSQLNYNPIVTDNCCDSVTIIYGESSVVFNQLNASKLHAQGYNGNGMHIAIFDAGFRDVDILDDYSHLHREDRILGTFDFVRLDNDVYREHPHGMRVLSALAAYRPGFLYGSAKDASYWLLRTEDVSSEYLIEEYNWLVAAEFADSAGADIINSSLGYTRFDDASMNYAVKDLDGQTSITAMAANMAFSRGILVVNSAGNYANDSNWQYIGTPADAPGVLAVGAVDDKGLRTSFSSVGPTADGRIKPDVMAMGRGVPVSGGNQNILYASGTSFAAPVIAGLAACLWQHFPDAKASDIKKAIKESAHQYQAPDSLYGFGIPDFQIATMAMLTSGTFLSAQHSQNYPITIFPNPITSDSYVSFQSIADDVVSIELINATGQIIRSIPHIQVQIGQNTFQPFNTWGTLKTGIYHVRIQSKYQKASASCFVLP